MRLRVITKDGKFVDYDIKVPICVTMSNLFDRYAVMIVEEKRDLMLGATQGGSPAGAGSKRKAKGGNKR